MDDLEEMMMMEAIRLSLAAEEDRRRKEEKEARKEAKRKGKEGKKAEKAARKSSLFTLNSNASAGEGAGSPMERSRSNLSLGMDDDAASASGKGKRVERESSPPVEGLRSDDDGSRGPYLPTLSLSGTSQESLASSIPIPGAAAEPFRRSHLRQMSNASSASSSFVESGPAAAISGTNTPPPGSLEPMFNFRSLAAMIGDDEKGEVSAHVELAEGEAQSLATSPGSGSKGKPVEQTAGGNGGSDSSDSSSEPDLKNPPSNSTEDKQGETLIETTPTTTNV